MSVQTISSNNRTNNIMATESNTLPQKTHNSAVISVLSSAENSHEKMSPPKIKGSKNIIVKFMNFLSRKFHGTKQPTTLNQAKEVTKATKAMKENIVNLLSKIKIYHFEILKTGQIHDVAKREVARELISPTTPRLVAAMLVDCAENAAKINDKKLLEECKTLFNKTVSYGRNREFWNPDAKQNQKLWSIDEQVTSDQKRQMSNLR